MLKVGIVGLPNVGKSTLFNTLLKKKVADVANYPFCTIEPNVGVIEVPDARLPVLADIVKTNTIIPAAIEFYDIAGLVKGASVGEGLGNKFLSHIREVDTIVHVVRLFEDNQIIHVGDLHEPVNDISTIDTELTLADVEVVTRQKTPKGTLSKEEKMLVVTLEKLRKHLDEGKQARLLSFINEELESIKYLNLLTLKPVIFVFNLSEQQLENLNETENKIQTILSQVGSTTEYIALSAKLETDLLELPETERAEYLSQFGLKSSGLDRLIQIAYSTLGLISYLTAGAKEVRAWTIKKGTLAPQAAGVIHTDFERLFIKAEIVPYKQFVEVGGWAQAKEKGVAKIVGRDYEIQDGDVVDFKVGV
ncbi:redox-regulated ATPase YchF [Candidatus Roizmanbacteria bacterium RIFCSPHIGHO2_01_FULL_39_12b]|uniref:Ribosome-binding ATPase YchF n=1 Tax=Candidatus Roizmanbacteria bacterium RIFCSPHIGHO2_01_FULL_39_12b TaxID=1802030 RepID=A0A1F7GBL7_9BACT|nr:MAG: redox-regulated ATPase YchF [Candidatus Roizmanbacteria bacterium RIFCSPHIGHO2_01_FULL_39_12b]